MLDFGVINGRPRRNKQQSRAQKKNRSKTVGRTLSSTKNVNQGSKLFSVQNQYKPVVRPPAPVRRTPLVNLAPRPIQPKVQAPVGGILLESEEKVYGNRCPPGYFKKELLGKGGCAVVWLATKGNETVALKQIAKSDRSAYEAGRKEIKYTDAVCRKPNDIFLPILDVIDTVKDLWIAFKCGGGSFGKQMFEIKGEFWRGERVYRVNHLSYLSDLRQSLEPLKNLLRTILQALEVLNNLRIIHSDLKPDNILVEGDQYQLIDFGSAIRFDKATSLQTNTPEYAPPESLVTPPIVLCEVSNPWSFDMWSLGMIFLEISVGFPLWLSLKSRVNGQGAFMMGLMAVGGREKEKILRQQEYILQNLRDVVKQHGMFRIHKDKNAMDLLSRMLEWEPSDRISPGQALRHPFLKI